MKLIFTLFFATFLTSLDQQFHIFQIAQVEASVLRKVSSKELLYQAILSNDPHRAYEAMSTDNSVVNAYYPFDGPKRSAMIFKAIELKAYDVIELMVKSSEFNIEILKPISNRTPLLYSIRRNDFRAVNTLLLAGANVNAKALFTTPLRFALRSFKNLKIIERLLEVENIDLNAGGRMCALRIAVRGGRLDIIGAIFKRYSSIKISERCLKGVKSQLSYFRSDEQRYDYVKDVEEVLASLL